MPERKGRIKWIGMERMEEIATNKGETAGEINLKIRIRKFGKLIKDVGNEEQKSDRMSFLSDVIK